MNKTPIYISFFDRYNEMVKGVCYVELRALPLKMKSKNGNLSKNDKYGKNIKTYTVQTAIKKQTA